MDKELVKRCRKNLGVHPDYIVDIIIAMNAKGCISSDYIRGIAENCIDGIVDDLIECADPDDWNEDDIRLAFGRVLTDKLDIGGYNEL